MPTTINATPAWKLNDEAFIDNPPSKKTAPHIAGAAFDQPRTNTFTYTECQLKPTRKLTSGAFICALEGGIAASGAAALGALIKVGLRGSRDVKGFHGHAIIETKGKPKLLAKIAALLLVFQ